MTESDPFVKAPSSVRANFTTRKYNNESEQNPKMKYKEGGSSGENGGDEEDTRERADEMTTAGKNLNQMYSHLCLGMIEEKKREKEKARGKKKKRGV